MSKHIFIGLGGSGVNIIAPIKYKIYQRTEATQDLSRIQVMKQDYRFMFIDTDSKDVNDSNVKYKGLYEEGRTRFISVDEELIDMGNLNPRVIYDSAKSKENRIDKRIIESCDNETSRLLANNPLRNGAGAIKYNSRLVFSRVATTFSNNLNANVTQLRDITQGARSEDIVYWVASSCNGGTGSGILNDVLYLINMTHKSIFGEGDPFVILTLCMPEIFKKMNQNIEKYSLNAFATLKEIEQFSVVSMSKDNKINKLIHRLAYADNHQQFEGYEYKPFVFCIPVDYKTSTGQMMSLEEMYSNTAEMLYYIHNSSVIKSWQDNFKEKSGLAPAEFLAPLGYVALRKPLKQFEDYMKKRLQYEFTRYGIVGEDMNSQEKNAVIKEHYNDYIFKRLLSKETEKSVLNEINKDLSTIEKSFPTSEELDEKKKDIDIMPVSEAENIYEGFKQKIDNYFKQNKEFIVNDIVSKLWLMVNEKVIRNGYKYALTLLRGLDDTCTSEVLKYQSNVNKSSRINIVSVLSSRPGELEDLYEQATKKGFLGKVNKQKISSYYQSLIGYVQTKSELYAKDRIYELLNDLCIGDNGEIDHIIDYVVSVYNEAETAATNAQQDYIELRKSFTVSKIDVTSIFLPDIEQFVTETGWKPKHFFAELYGELIEPTNILVSNYGFKPLRNGDSDSKSLQSFINEMCKTFGEQSMISKGYMSANNENNLFINRMIQNPKKIIEDIQNYASDTISLLISRNNVIRDRWFKKSLKSFIYDLDSDKLTAMSDRMKPTLFFPYNINRYRVFQEKRIFVASMDIAEWLFGFQPNNDNQSLITTAENDDIVYSIIANLGMSFDYYINYSILEKLYNDCPDKKYYHFHKLIGESSGDLSKIRPPYEAEPKKIDFVRFIIMNQYAEILKEAYYTSNSPMEKNKYASSPLQITDGMATIFKNSSFSINDGKITLDKGLRGNPNYVEIAPHEKTMYSEIFSKFSDIYINDQLSIFITNLITEMKNNYSSIMIKNFRDVITEINNQITQHWEKTESISEKDFMQEISQILSMEFDKYEKLYSK